MNQQPLVEAPAATEAPKIIAEQQLGQPGQVMTRDGWKDFVVEPAAPAPPPASDAPALGLEAAERMQTLSAAAARDILLLGQTILGVAEQIDADCRRLAQDMAEQGNKVSQHIRDFATIARTIGVTNRDTRLRIEGETRRGEDE